MYADVANYSEYVNNTASTGLIFSSASMAQKFGSAFGGAAVMWILSAFDYNTAPGAVQPEAAITGIRAMMSFIPAALAAVALILLCFYPLTTSRVDFIVAELKKRHLPVNPDSPEKAELTDPANNL